MKDLKTTEAQEHKQLCDYIRLQHPSILFNTDMSGIKLTIGQATQAKKLRSERGFPDLMIFEPRNGWNGLFIELKRTGEKIFKKNGELKTDHLREQSEVLEKLFKRGYLAMFCIGFEEAKNAIDQYLK